MDVCVCVCVFICRYERSGVHACVFASVSVCLLGRVCACVNVAVCVYSYL